MLISKEKQTNRRPSRGSQLVKLLKMTGGDSLERRDTSAIKMGHQKGKTFIALPGDLTTGVERVERWSRREGGTMTSGLIVQGTRKTKQDILAGKNRKGGRWSISRVGKYKHHWLVNWLVSVDSNYETFTS